MSDGSELEERSPRSRPGCRAWPSASSGPATTPRPPDLTTRVDGLTETPGYPTERTHAGFVQVRSALHASAAGQAHIIELPDQLVRREA